MTDIVTIGDSSVDLFMKIEGDGVIEETDGDMPKICFFHGSKIPVDDFETTIAGNALNVAVGTKMLGIKTVIYSEIGDDQNTVEIYKGLRKIGVNTKYLRVNKETSTDVHAVIVYKGERTIFSYHGDRTYKVKNIPKSKWIYYTSMGDGFDVFQRELIEHLKNSKVGLAFNPGTIQMRAGVDRLKNILGHTDILFVNKEEGERIAGIETEDVKELHKKLQELGPKLTVITDADKGASADNSAEYETHEIYSDDKPLLDMTGAGDAFSSGFMSAIIRGKSLKEALSWGIINSGSVIKEIGAIRGLVDKKSMEELVKNV
jgi:sugar/nucleoside kinase (ribokinase family)